MIALTLLITPLIQDLPVILLSEDFEDNHLEWRGWYDLPGGRLESFGTEGHAPESKRSLRAHFLRGDRSPTPKVVARHLFAESDAVYLSYWVKYSEDWVGSGKPYHPHEFHFLTNVDSDYVGPSHTHLTVYVEHNYQNGGIAVLSLQDAANIDRARIGRNLTSVSERRAVAGCNGDPGRERGDCFQAGGEYNNSRIFKSVRPVFTPGKGAASQNDWHRIEAYFRLNSIKRGRGQRDGVAQYWIDGKLVIDRHDVLFRTAVFPRMKFRQFMIAPYIGDGSPVEQSVWYDDIVVMTRRP
ncbi:MAG: hypothetical protein HY700_14000 [Gemmatimonadetes bacterium]|nr:hypothetical protein [Gemmatimonadota bacterium]